MTDAPAPRPSASLKLPLLFLGALVIVVLFSWFYTRGLLDTPDPAGTHRVSTPAPALEDLHPELQAGIEAMRTGDLDASLEHLSLVDERDPSYSVALHSRAEAYRRRGELDAAHELLIELTRVQPENPEVYVLLGSVEYDLARFRDAELALLRAIELDPDHVRARYGVALFRTAQGDVARAVQAYGRAIARDAQGAHFLQARLDLQKLRDERPEIAASHYLLAFVANRLGDQAEERFELEQFLRLEPEGPAAELAREKLAGLDQAGPSGP